MKAQPKWHFHSKRRRYIGRWSPAINSSPDTGPDRRHPRPRSDNDDDDKKPKSGGSTRSHQKRSYVVQAKH